MDADRKTVCQPFELPKLLGSIGWEAYCYYTTHQKWRSLLQLQGYILNANYKFLFINIGQYRSNTDGGVFQKSEWGQMFLNRELDMPEPKCIEGAPQIGALPHFIVVDEAFLLRIDLMWPFPWRRKNENLPDDKAIFNYRLSRARRIVENAFGILAQCWRLLNRHIQLKEDNVIQVVKACAILHNFLRETADYQDRSNLNVANDGSVLLPEGAAIINTAYLRGYHSAKGALDTRNVFKAYFCRPADSVPWQFDRI